MDEPWLSRTPWATEEGRRGGGPFRFLKGCQKLNPRAVSRPALSPPPPLRGAREVTGGFMRRLVSRL